MLLGRHLSRYRIEQLMERLTTGYQRALAESEPERRDAIWLNLHAVEEDLHQQFARFALDFAKVDEPHARVSRLPFAIPLPPFCLGRAVLTYASCWPSMPTVLAGWWMRPPTMPCHCPQRPGLHHAGRNAADAAQLPLVLQIQGGGLGRLLARHTRPRCCAQ